MGPADTDAERLTSRPLVRPEELRAEWGAPDLLTLPLSHGPYRAGFAHSDRALAAAQRLRYGVFNLELGEGLADAADEGLDRDAFDAQMVHLVLIDEPSGSLIGTYRMQSAREAEQGLGFYAAQEYDLTPLAPYTAEAVELGRACLAKEHRTFEAIALLWQGIGAYMTFFGLRYLFGCSSLTSRDPRDGWRAMATIRRLGYLHPEVYAAARPGYACGPDDTAPAEAIPLPKLFKTYMRLGARVVSEPAIDRAFGTVDFLILMDGRGVQLSQLDVLP